MAWARSRTSGSWLWGIRRNWAGWKKVYALQVIIGNLNVCSFSPRGLSCMCARSVVDLPFPKIANNFSHHIRKGTFTIVGGL